MLGDPEPMKGYEVTKFYTATRDRFAPYDRIKVTMYLPGSCGGLMAKIVKNQDGLDSAAAGWRNALYHGLKVLEHAHPGVGYTELAEEYETMLEVEQLKQVEENREKTYDQMYNLVKGARTPEQRRGARPVIERLIGTYTRQGQESLVARYQDLLKDL